MARVSSTPDTDISGDVPVASPFTKASEPTSPEPTSPEPEAVAGEYVIRVWNGPHYRDIGFDDGQQASLAVRLMHVHLGKGPGYWRGLTAGGKEITIFSATSMEPLNFDAWHEIVGKNGEPCRIDDLF